MIALARFLTKIEPEPWAGGCWLWRGATGDGRYGRFWFEGRTLMAHRWIYERLVGPIPTGHDLDHFHCEVTLCVNPWHVRPATPRENVLRADSITAAQLAQTHCKRGHEFTPENTRIYRGMRVCRRCDVLKQRRYVAQRKEMVLVAP